MRLATERGRPSAYLECLLDTAVVRDVLALREDSVDVQSGVGNLVRRVLIDNALRPVGEVGEGLHVPPVLQVADLVELASWKNPPFVPKSAIALSSPWSSNPWVISCPMTAPIPP